MTTGIVTDLVNGMLSAITDVIPLRTKRDAATLVSAPIMHVHMGVLIGVTGQVRGRLLVVGEEATFCGVAEGMFGMRLEGEMLESFVGELGNMIGGAMSTNVSRDGISIDITPPTVIVGDTKFTGFQRALSVPVTIEGVGSLQVLLITEE